MEALRWLAANWFNILSAVGIIGGLFFTAVSLRSETKTRQISNQLAMTANHREVWKELFHRPELVRVIDASADLLNQVITPQEQEFVNLVVLQTSSVYEALKDGLVIKQKACVRMWAPSSRSRSRRRCGRE